MTPVLRVKFGLLMIGALFAAAVAWNAAQGQIRPPVVRPPVGPRPINPPGGFPRTGPTIVKVWTCSGCGKELGRGLTAPPDHCPHCGARIINGVGNGIRQPGMGGGVVPPNPTPPANPPGMVPTPPPGANPNPNPPQMNPPVVNPNPPAFNPNPPVANPVASDTGPANLSSNDSSSSSSSSGGLSKGKVAAIVIGIIVVGVFVLVGGTWLMIYTMESSEPQPRRRRRRRNEDYDD